MRFGLADEILADLRACLTRARVSGAQIFGSRARGDFRPGSDIDLAVDAAHLTAAEFGGLCAALDAVPMVFALDVVRLDHLPPGSLRDAIDRDGQPL